MSTKVAYMVTWDTSPGHKDADFFNAEDQALTFGRAKKAAGFTDVEITRIEGRPNDPDLANVDFAEYLKLDLSNYRRKWAGREDAGDVATE